VPVVTVACHSLWSERRLLSDHTGVVRAHCPTTTAHRAASYDRNTEQRAVRLDHRTARCAIGPQSTSCDQTKDSQCDRTKKKPAGRSKHRTASCAIWTTEQLAVLSDHRAASCAVGHRTGTVAVRSDRRADSCAIGPQNSWLCDRTAEQLDDPRTARCTICPQNS
jgi:hypothetical protein